MKNDPVNIHQAEIPGWYVTFNQEDGVSHSEQFTEKKHALIYAKQKRDDVEQRRLRDDLTKSRPRIDDSTSEQISQQPRRIIFGFNNSANWEKLYELGIWETKEMVMAKTQ